MKIRAMTLVLQFILLVSIVMSAVLLTSYEQRAHDRLKYQEKLAGYQNKHLTYGTLLHKQSNLEAEILIMKAEFNFIQCQMDIVAAASRTSWRKAERLIQTRAIVECGMLGEIPEIKTD